MREIKFRAWDKQAECWRYFQIGAPFTDFQSDLYERLCVMGSRFYEFTGLKDKKGKDIYEGDIIQNVSDDGSRFSKFEVRWQQSSSGFIKEREDGNQFTLEISRFYDVIGNVYENPELIDKKI